MRRDAVPGHRADAIADLCRAGHAPAALRDGVLARLRATVPFDAAFWTTLDPVTLLFTAPHQEDIPPETAPYLVDNEFLGDDVMPFVALARDRTGVRTLAQVTGGQLEASARYRDVFRPLGLGDELRAVLRVGGVSWGCLCLHREAGTAFSEAEAAFVRRIAPSVAEGIRGGLLAASVDVAEPADGPGLLLLADDGSLQSCTDAGRRWLDELGHPDVERHGVPAEIRALAARLERSGAGPPRLRVRTAAGRWAVLHASRLPAGGANAVAVIVAEATPADLAPVLMLAYGLTEREQTVAELVCRGRSTREISAWLHIAESTVQDHLKSIFAKTGVRSRRELVATILREQYLPRAMSGRRLAPAGSFME
jgi:DNA-binding CsgD family transcriptional regulator